MPGGHVPIIEGGNECEAMTKCVKVLRSKSKSKQHGSITGSDLSRNGLIRACDLLLLLLVTL